MGWSIGWDARWNRDVGYDVIAYCDQPGCKARIDRGLSYVCGGQPYGGDTGCGLFFCGQHRAAFFGSARCERCEAGQPPFDPKPDHPEWDVHRLEDPTWSKWRAENGYPDMLRVEFTNDLTGDMETGHYRVEVSVNGQTIHRERIEGHPRESGWRTLVRRLGHAGGTLNGMSCGLELDGGRCKRPKGHQGDHACA